MKKIILMMSMLLLFVVSCGTKEFSVDVDGKGKVPNFELKDLNGKSADLGKIMKNGKKTLFIVAAEWCPHCKEELPEVQKFYDENKDSINVAVVFTSRRTNLTSTKQFVAENKFTFPVYYDANQSLMKGFKIKSVPTNIVIQNSVIENINEGILDYDSLKQLFYIN